MGKSTGKKLLGLCLFLLVIDIFAQIPKDKQLHYGAGIITGTIGYEYVYIKTKDRKKAFIAGITTSFLAGAFKETIDATQKGNKFDAKDLLATTLGGFTITINLNYNEKLNNRIINSFRKHNKRSRKKRKQISKRSL